MTDTRKPTITPPDEGLASCRRAIASIRAQAIEECAQVALREGLNISEMRLSSDERSKEDRGSLQYAESVLLSLYGQINALLKG